MIPASYVAVLGSGDEDWEAATAAALDRLPRGYRLLLATRRLQVWGAGGIAALIVDDGVVLGSIHRRDGDRVRAFSAVDRHAIAGSRGQALVDAYWGSYLALWEDPDGHRAHALRAPCGRLGCYRLNYRGALVLSNDARLLRSIGMFAAEVDWSYVATHLLYEHQRPLETGLVGLKEVAAGVRLTCSTGSAEERPLWSPWRFAERARLIDDRREATELVKAVATRCVESSATGFDRVMLGVSGGLDSSIVASCLAARGIPTQCFTLVGPGAGGDERNYAQALCNHLSLPLVELFEDTRLVDITRSDAAHLPRPVARAFAQSGDRLQRHLANASGARAYFTGAGGDNVFAYIPSVSPVADRLLVERPGRGVIETAVDIGRMTGTGLFRVLAGAIRRAWLRRPAYRWPRDRMGLTEEAIASAGDRARHPWLDAPVGAIPGKAAHIAWLLGIENHLEGFGRELDRPLVAPLMMQPLVETCLAIPTWAWCEGGRNRAIARDAFADALPVEIVERRSKGSPDGFSVRLFEDNRRTIEEMILDGSLVDRGIVDRQQVSALLGKAALSSHDYSRLLAFVDVEAWIASWQGAQ